jgi:hypothetical protein
VMCGCLLGVMRSRDLSPIASPRSSRRQCLDAYDVQRTIRGTAADNSVAPADARACCGRRPMAKRRVRGRGISAGACAPLCLLGQRILSSE